MFSLGVIKAIGWGATAAGIGANLLADWVAEQKQDALIEEKVNKALAEKEMKNADETEEA